MHGRTGAGSTGSRGHGRGTRRSREPRDSRAPSRTGRRDPGGTRLRRRATVSLPAMGEATILADGGLRYLCVSGERLLRIPGLTRTTTRTGRPGRGAPERYLLFGLDQLITRGWTRATTTSSASVVPPAWARATGAAFEGQALERAGGYGGDFATVPRARSAVANRLGRRPVHRRHRRDPVARPSRCGGPACVRSSSTSTIGLPERVARLRTERDAADVCTRARVDGRRTRPTVSTRLPSYVAFMAEARRVDP